MTTITYLPNEVITMILQQKDVSIRDVVSFGFTCKRFHGVIDNNKLWQKKLYQRWPCLKRIHDKRLQKNEHINFKDNAKDSIKRGAELRRYLTLMSERFIHMNELSDNDLEDFNVLLRSNVDANTMNYCFIKEELIYLIGMFPISPYCNLTHKYYSKKLLPYLQRRNLKNVWQEFMSYPKEQQLLEQAATIVAQWYQPQKSIFYSDVKALLDNIAQRVLENLKNAYREHPISSTSAEQFSFWKHNNINDKQWTKKEEKQIIDVLRMVLFNELGFRKASISDPNVLNPKPEDILIDCVLESKVGNAISLAIIFQSVARRLGVRCDLISFPTHFFLSWKPKCTKNSEEEEECFYIDILNDGAIRGRDDCPKIRGKRCPIESFNNHTEISPREIVLRMINYLQMVNPNYQHHEDRTLQMRSLLEFRHMIEPHNVDTIEMLGRHYMQNQINLSSLISTLLRVETSAFSTRVEVRKAADMLMIYEMHNAGMPTRGLIMQERPKKIKYAVGMIVTCYSSYTKSQTGVIIGWDKTYNSSVNIEPEYRISYNHSCSGVDSLKQPFYTILSENGKTYYVVEDSLIEACPPRWIEHNEIGRYFCKFAQSHYVPNSMLTRYYPFDLAILNTLRLPEALHCPDL